MLAFVAMRWGGFILRRGGLIARDPACCCGTCCDAYEKAYVPVQLTHYANPGCVVLEGDYLKYIPRVEPGHYRIDPSNCAWEMNSSVIRDCPGITLDFWCFEEDGVSKMRMRVVSTEPPMEFGWFLPGGTVYDHTIDCDPDGGEFGCDGRLPWPYSSYFSFSVQRSIDSCGTPNDHSCA